MNKECSCGHIPSLWDLKDCCSSAIWFLVWKLMSQPSAIDCSSRIPNLVCSYAAMQSSKVCTLWVLHLSMHRNGCFALSLIYTCASAWIAIPLLQSQRPENFLCKLLVPWGGEWKVASPSAEGRGRRASGKLASDASLGDALHVSQILTGKLQSPPITTKKALLDKNHATGRNVFFSSTCKLSIHFLKTSLWSAWRCSSKNNFNRKDSVHRQAPYDQHNPMLLIPIAFQCFPLDDCSWGC